MSGMVLQYNSPEIYILGSTNKIQELNMDGLFVSPAGRELMKQKSQYHHKTKIKHNNEFSKTLPTLSLLTENIDKKEINVTTTSRTSPKYNNNNNEENLKKCSLFDDNMIPTITTDSIQSTSSSCYPTSSPCSTSSCSSSLQFNNNVNENVNVMDADSQIASEESTQIRTSGETEKITEESTATHKSTENYYEEELELLLGINCVLEDDCRCFECQSSYFDYTEDDDFDENLEGLKNSNSTTTGSCRRHHSNHATNMYCCIQ